MGRGSRGPVKNVGIPSSEKAGVKIWMDDDLVDRKAPEGWIHVTTAFEAIDYLKKGDVIELSLDHDLGDDELYGRGVDVVDFLCEQAFNGNPVWPKKIHLHTANPYGRDSMIRSLQRYNPNYRSTVTNGQPTLEESGQ